VDAEVGGEKILQAGVEVGLIAGFPDAADDLLGIDAEVEAEETIETFAEVALVGFQGGSPLRCLRIFAEEAREGASRPVRRCGM
jgi:hypothetical protein